MNRFLKLSVNDKGYLYLDIRHKNSILRAPKLHRLMMLAFSDDVEKEQVNHIDGDKKNNHISNLEWVTNLENRKHAIRTGLMKGIAGKIAQCDLDDNILNVFDSVAEAIELLELENALPSNIGRCIYGKRKTAYGFKWKEYNISTTIETD